MSERLKIIIADDEPLICRMLQKLIDFDTFSLDLVDVCSDGESLYESILAHSPHIVLTDISMPKVDGLEVVRRAYEAKLKCRFILISGYRNFEYAYTALKYNVEDYLLKPVDETELTSILKRLVSEIRNEHRAFSQNTGRARAIQMMVDAMTDKDGRQYTVRDFNESYALKLEEALFRVLLVRFDFINHEQLYSDGDWQDPSSLINKVECITKELFSVCTFELVYERKPDGVRILINYSPEYRTALGECIVTSFRKIRAEAHGFKGISVTFCLSSEGTEIRRLPDLVMESRVSEWTRMNHGLDRIIEYESNESGDESLKEEMMNLKKDALLAVDTLDDAGFREAIERFFSLPMDKICTESAFLCIRQIKNHLLRQHEETISEYADVDTLISSINRSLHLATDFGEYRAKYIDSLSEIIQKVSEQQKKKNARPIIQAMAYIEKNYGSPLSLENVAERVRLSPVYFSNLFKKETGKNFTSYVNEVRINAACEMLKNGNKNVSEIAYDVGFSDVRYFSKQFKKELGLKPSEYRKIYC